MECGLKYKGHDYKILGGNKKNQATKLLCSCVNHNFLDKIIKVDVQMKRIINWTFFRL